MRSPALPHDAPISNPPQIAFCGTSSSWAAETAQRWQEIGGIEGVSLEWMLDHTRVLREAMT